MFGRQSEFTGICLFLEFILEGGGGAVICLFLKFILGGGGAVICLFLKFILGGQSEYTDICLF